MKSRAQRLTWRTLDWAIHGGRTEIADYLRGLTSQAP
jgi:hypothetical protein